MRKAVEDERVARDQWRANQRKLDEAREALAAAERAAGELATRRSALDESRARLEEILKKRRSVLRKPGIALAKCRIWRAIAQRLSALTSEVQSDRAALAEARAAMKDFAARPMRGCAALK